VKSVNDPLSSTALLSRMTKLKTTALGEAMTKPRLCGRLSTERPPLADIVEKVRFLQPLIL
jgi:hypothetical protein